MYGADYAWILQGGPSDAWWTNTSSLIDTTDCSPQELAEATEGLILVSSHNSIVGTDPSLSGLVSFTTLLPKNSVYFCNFFYFSDKRNVCF